MLTIGEAAKRAGVSRDTVKNYIREGKIQAERRERYGKSEHVIEESELAKLPKPYKKRGQAESGVPQGPHPTLPPLVKARVAVFEGSQEQVQTLVSNFY